MLGGKKAWPPLQGRVPRLGAPGMYSCWQERSPSLLCKTGPVAPMCIHMRADVPRPEGYARRLAGGAGMGTGVLAERQARHIAAAVRLPPPP